MAVKYIHPVKPKSAEGLVAEVYFQIKRDFGRIVEPFTLHSPSPRLLAGAWMACRESEIVGIVPRGLKEAIAASISKLNQCPYCVDAHTIMLAATGKDRLAKSISKQSIGSITDRKARSIIEWSLATLSPDSKLLLQPPFSRREAAEIIGTAIFYHYINPLVTILLGKTPLPSNSPWLKGGLKRVASRFFSKTIRNPKNPAEASHFLEEKELPADLGWAMEAPNLAGAYARFAGVIEEAGEASLPAKVREQVIGEIDKWKGKPLGLSLGWVKKAAEDLDAASEVALRLALLTALAPHKINKEVVIAYSNLFPGEARLLEALAWASFTKARKIGTWLHVPVS